MVSLIDPAIESLNALSDWSQLGKEFLVVKKGKTSDGKRVSYVDVGEKPKLYQVLWNGFLNFFGGEVTWRLENVATMIDENVSRLEKLNDSQKSTLDAAVNRLNEINTRHKGKVSDKVIQRLMEFLCHESLVSLSAPPLTRGLLFSLGREVSPDRPHAFFSLTLK